MKKSKLIDVLSTFNKSEIKQFRDFVKSPFFNKRQELVTFYELLIKHHPDFPEKKIDRMVVFSKLYPKQAFDEKQLGYLMSYLSKLTEQFIALQKYESDELMPEYYQLKAFIERDLFKHYRQNNKKTQEKLLQHEKSSTFLLKKYLISEVANQYFFLQQKRKHDQNLQIASDNLDLFYITTKLEYSCEMLNRKNVLGADYQINLIDQLQNPLQETALIQEPLTALYLHLYQMLKTEINPENISKLRLLIQKETHNFSKDETQKFYRYAINFCLQMLRKGQYEYMEQAVELYLDGIERRIFYNNNQLSPWVYTNVIRLSNALKRYEFAKEFTKKYNADLPEEFRENALHYNLAEIYYSSKNFDKAIFHLNQVKFSDIQIHLGSREMLLKIYYETDAEEALLSLIASFSIFLKRNKNMSNELKRPFLNFCDLLNQLMRRNPKKLPEIRIKIQETNPMTSRSWLLKICDDIMKSVGLTPESKI